MMAHLLHILLLLLLYESPAAAGQRPSLNFSTHLYQLPVYSIYLCCMICLANVPFFLLILVKMSSTSVCSLFLFLHVTPNIILSIPLWALLHLQIRANIQNAYGPGSERYEE